MANENIMRAMVPTVKSATKESGFYLMPLVEGSKQEGLDNDLMLQMKSDPFFALIHKDMGSILEAKAFVARSQQVIEFIDQEVKKITTQSNICMWWDWFGLPHGSRWRQGSYNTGFASWPLISIKVG